MHVAPLQASQFIRLVRIQVRRLEMLCSIGIGALEGGPALLLVHTCACVRGCLWRHGGAIDE